MTLSLTTLSIMALNTFMLNVYAECRNRPVMLSVIMPRAVMLNVVMLSVVAPFSLCSLVSATKYSPKSYLRV